MADMWTMWDARSRARPEPEAEPERGAEAEAPLRAAPARLPDPAAIPPRAWLYGTRLISGFVSVLAAPGGVGKSALALAQAVAVASGRGFLGEQVHRRTGAWVLNLEDPLDELDRRVAAILRLHALPAEAVAGRLFLHSGRTRRLSMAASLDGQIVHPDRDAVAAQAVAAGIGLIVVDPFVKSHALDENSNGQMDAAATAWAEVAERSGAAVLLVHHTRKLAAGGADVEATRGAKSLTDAARSAALLVPMTAEEAERLGVPEATRWRHVRLDDAKANLAPRAESARWFRLETVALGNGTADYPGGDSVAAVTAWRPPSAFAALDTPSCNAALDRIAAGPGEGAAWSAHRTGRGAERWAGRVLIDEFGLDEGAAARVVGAWLKSGLLVEQPYRDAAQRKTRLGVRVNDALRPTAQRPSSSNSERTAR